MRVIAKFLAVTVTAGMLAASTLTATLLKQMNLEELAGNAHRIFSGTVIEVDKGSISLGGGTVATVTYRVVVDTPFLGEFIEKSGRKIADIRMVHAGAPGEVAGAVRFPVLPKMPVIELGKRYLFFTTEPSAAGLSTTVGLGQGCFEISGEPGDELAVNEFENLGLFRGMSGAGTQKPGPVEYSSLVRQIHDLLSRN